MADIALAHADARRTAPLPGAVDRRIEKSAPLTRFVLRLPEESLTAAGAALGLDFTAPINRAVTSGDRTALRLGPDEWLVLAPATDAAIPGGLAAGLAGRLFSLVDVSHRQTGIRLAGPHAAAMINAVCPLDLGLAAFPVGMATRTIFAKADIVLWRTSPASFHLEIWRSFAPYVAALLHEIGREYPD
ncbi:sarcosine oxidase subunit gamma [Acidiphilium sp. PA]|uniref:sarcosine oxidase subunit gamma n=1 Tax=Acidiphilium sp. PA TaxID=2871705 RepID=UPI0022430322|nr:sarcosine oxidase subunit gamma family protein [Acidiphilium sp. PA]MCW8307996.1 sarcosine oxidase subunit gamma [Acidiphilium sp. PA]